MDYISSAKKEVHNGRGVSIYRERGRTKKKWNYEKKVEVNTCLARKEVLNLVRVSWKAVSKTALNFRGTVIR